MGGILKLCALICCIVTGASATLSPNFYDSSCPNLTDIVIEAMGQANDSDPVNMPAILRLFAHDAMVNGADGSVLLDTVPGGIPAEKDSPSNADLFGFEAIENAKFQVEEQCPGIVSCADILALSAQIVVQMVGGPVYATPLGRRDTRVSKASDATAQLPLPTMNLTTILANFAAKGLSLLDLVVLTGAHTIGFAHCASFSKRIYNYNSTYFIDPSLDGTFALQLQDICPPHPPASTVQALDVSSIDTFDNGFYQNLQIQEGILSSDQILEDDPRTSFLADSFASDQDSFFANFTISMIKLGGINVLTGSAGEIRLQCNETN